MEENGKEIGKVYRTKDLSIFKSHELNRTLHPGLLKKLRKSMEKNGWLKGSIVIVFPSMKILDGHHRITVAKELGLPVDYTIVKSNDYSLIIENNKAKQVWSFMNNIETQVKLENKNYVLLDRFMKNFPYLRPTECIMLVKNGMNSGSREEIEGGDLKIGDLKKAYEWGHHLMTIKPFFPKYYNKSIFVRALVKIFSTCPEFRFDEFMKKIELRPTSLKPCGTVDQYVQLIEDIYNYRRNNDDKIRFKR